MSYYMEPFYFCIHNIQIRAFVLLQTSSLNITCELKREKKVVFRKPVFLCKKKKKGKKTKRKKKPEGHKRGHKNASIGERHQFNLNLFVMQEAHCAKYLKETNFQ